MILDIDYSNFKDSVEERQGEKRAKIYHKVWSTLYPLQQEKPISKLMVRSQAPNLSYGGVIFDGNQRVLLRKPRNEFDGYAWTFAKGRARAGQTSEETALREVREETGYDAEIIARIPGSFLGGTGSTEYFLMMPLGEPHPFDPSETEAIQWVSWERATEHIGQTRNPIGRERDLAVLDAAIQTARETASRVSWKNLPMPEQRIRLLLEMILSEDEAERLRCGHLPEEMEDKWFIFHEKGWVYFCRSWTGYCVFQIKLTREGDGYRVDEAWANRDPEQYRNENAQKDVRLLKALMFNRFGIGTEPPSERVE